MQKFKKGSLVRIAKDLGSMMSHFENDCEAVVEYTYAEKYWGDDTKSYSLFLPHGGTSAWYREHQLTLIEEDGEYKKLEWEAERKAKDELSRDLETIYNSKVETLDGETCRYLWEGIMNLGSIWGRSGEGFVAYENQMKVQYLYSICVSKDYTYEQFMGVCEENKVSNQR